MHDPDLLVLDEPTDGLDPVGRNEVRQVIERLSEAGKTIFLNSHILQEVELVCTRVAILASGKIKIVGSIDEIANTEQSRLVVHIKPSTNQLAMDLAKDRLQDLLERAEVGSFELVSVGQDGWQLATAMENQSQIDRVVDVVRSHQFSINHLQIVRPSLEETFIRLVGETDAPSSDESTDELTPEQQSTIEEAK